MEYLFIMDTLSLDKLTLNNLDNLFSHPGFRLIFIDNDGNMSLEGPFDEESRKKVQEYRCISHVWGTADKTKDYAWKDHGIANVTWKAEVREEKRERLFQIFNHHKGYWWMDVFCTNQEDEHKPLDVMGDIYRECVECVCLLDTICDVDGFTSEKDMLISLAKDTGELMETGKDYYRKHKKKCKKFVNNTDYFDNLENCSWFQRVWTWQEAVLPPRLLFCCEQAGTYRYDPFSPELLKELFPCKLLEVGDVSVLEGSFLDGMKEMIIKYGIFARALLCLIPITTMNTKNDIWQNILTMMISDRKCTEQKDFVYGIMGILNLTVPKGLELGETIIESEKSLQRQGIFFKEEDGVEQDDVNKLSDVYEGLPIDGITILGRVGDDMYLKFNPGVVQECESHGKILSREPYDNDIYDHICYKYTTETSIIYLETDQYNIGDILETTKIGREGCTFKQMGEKYKENEIFEIIDLRVKTIGHINNEDVSLTEEMEALNSDTLDDDLIDFLSSFDDQLEE